HGPTSSGTPLCLETCAGLWVAYLLNSDTSLPAPSTSAIPESLPAEPAALEGSPLPLPGEGWRVCYHVTPITTKPVEKVVAGCCLIAGARSRTPPPGELTPPMPRDECPIPWASSQ